MNERKLEKKNYRKSRKTLILFNSICEWVFLLSVIKLAEQKKQKVSSDDSWIIMMMEPSIIYYFMASSFLIYTLFYRYKPLAQ